MTVRVRTIDVGAAMGGAVLGMAVLPKETDGIAERKADRRTRCRLRVRLFAAQLGGVVGDGDDVAVGQVGDLDRSRDATLGEQEAGALVGGWDVGG